jgi:hypothetical protein
MVGSMPLLKDKAQQSQQASDGSLNDLAASIASKLARNVVPLTDPQRSVPPEGGSFSGQHDANISPPRGAETVLLDQPPRSRQSAEEYRRRADACLAWAREASTDDIRLACLALATAWLKAALREDGDGADHLPLAPSL